MGANTVNGRGARTLKIAVLHFGFFYSGGGEKLVLEEVGGLRSLGHQVSCYAPFVDRDSCFPDRLEMGEVQSLLPPPPKWLPLRHALWVIASCALAPLFARRFRQHDVILAANQPAPWIGLIIGKLLRKPYVVYLAQPFRLIHPRDIDRSHGLRIRDGDQRFVHWVTRVGGGVIDWADRLSINEAALVLTNGEYATRWISQVYARDTLNCPAGSHMEGGRELPAIDKWSGVVRVGNESIGKPYILVTNRHAPHKRFEYAIWALKALRRRKPDTRLVITGQASGYTEQLQYLVRGLNLQNYVHFVGLVSEPQLAKLYQEAAVYIYPAPEEDFGMGMVEAMASGTPVIAWNRAGPTGIVEHGQTGYLITPYDTDEFAERISDLLTNRELNRKLGIRSLEVAKTRFSYESHNRTVAWALQSALNEATWREQPAHAIALRAAPGRVEASVADVEDCMRLK